MTFPTRPVSANPVGTAFSRYITAKALGRGDLWTELQIAEQWVDTPQVKATLELQTKAAVAPASTTDSTWASPIAPYGIAAEAITISRSKPSIFGQLVPLMQNVPLHVKIARETGAGITGGWVTSGGPIPVQKTDFATVIEEHYKYGVIVPLAEELVRVSSPSAEATVRRKLLGPDGGLAAAIDNQFLLPTVAFSAGVNPASVTAGSTEITTTGTTSAQIAADLAGLLAAVTSPGPLVWIMRPRTMYRIALVLGSQAAGLPNTLSGAQVIASNNSPAQITLLDPSAILYSDTGQFAVDVSTNALVQLDTAPADPTVAATVLQSAYQRNDVMVRALRWLAWLNPSPTTSAAFMTVAY
jgi:HK97 family phage major capsid protein